MRPYPRFLVGDPKNLLACGQENAPTSALPCSHQNCSHIFCPLSESGSNSFSRNTRFSRKCAGITTCFNKSTASWRILYSYQQSPYDGFELGLLRLHFSGGLPPAQHWILSVCLTPLLAVSPLYFFVSQLGWFVVVLPTLELFAGQKLCSNFSEPLTWIRFLRNNSADFLPVI